MSVSIRYMYIYYKNVIYSSSEYHKTTTNEEQLIDVD